MNTSDVDGPGNDTFVEPRTQAWLEEFEAATAGAPPVYELSPQDARQAFRHLQASVPVDLATADLATADVATTDIEDRTIAGGPTGEVDIRIVRPREASGALPVVLHCRGGGWVLGDKDTHDRLIRELAVRAGAVVVFVDYTPAPEARYPVQNEQAYAALEWVAANPTELAAAPNRIAVVGDSAGGAIAAALTLMAKQRRGPRIAAQVLFYPTTDANFHTPTYERFAEGPWLTRRAMEWFWDAYLPDHGRRSEPTAAPLRASSGQLGGLPRALVINGENDVLRDEGEAYARRLAQAGVRVTQVRYGGTIHDFVLLNPIARAPAARAGTVQAGEFLREALAR
ncbi:alpha/beta hydrolase [Actinopolymorpha pittospori]|uniref:Acetyl esterase n=1 Tax=Actinopolymorpha pittospori TaxID=648752 RepID=A0A927MU87_9ACTN|nr:alpha/beta hydrolase [Actinopolymorpha pittospori]MBE1607010.1 acetyl esterase [Actinopolymorpha pittospori]